MSNSEFCIQQRKLEQRRLKKLLLFGLAGSALLHGILAYNLPRWSISSPTQTEKPIELIIVDQPQPKPQIESKPIVEPKPKPIPKTEPVKAVTPSQTKRELNFREQAEVPRRTTPVKQLKPVQPETTPPKPTPQKVLTNPTPAPSQSVISAPIEDTSPSTFSSNSFNNSSSSVSPAAESGSSNSSVPGAVAVGSSAPPRPQPNSSQRITCVSNCKPEYPAVLAGVEGNAGIKLTIDPNGNVTSATITRTHSNSQLNRQALLAARKMKFSSPPSGSSGSVIVKIDFTVAGSEYDRTARQEQRERERAEKERIQQEAARQQQLE